MFAHMLEMMPTSSEPEAPLERVPLTDESGATVHQLLTFCGYESAPPPNVVDSRQVGSFWDLAKALSKWQVTRAQTFTGLAGD